MIKKEKILSIFQTLIHFQTKPAKRDLEDLQKQEMILIVPENSWQKITNSPMI